MTGRRRWGFRARLTALIAAVFVGGGAILLGAQYFLVKGLFDEGIRNIVWSCPTGFSTVDGWVNCYEPEAIERALASGGSLISDPVIGTIKQATLLAEQVLWGLLIGSMFLLAAFAGAAVLVARWLSRRSLVRIARITDAAREIDRDDLQRRLALPAPDDEIKELGDTIDGMLDRLADAIERQDRFIAGASHELRTPLTTTRTLLEIPLEQGRIPPDLEPAVRGALAANARSEQLISALLTLARSSGAIARSGDPPVDMAALARVALAEHQGEVDVRRLSVRIPDDAVPAVADASLAAIAVGNLVVNAIRHSPAGSRIEVGAEVAAEGGTACANARLVVENDGRVLSPSEVARLTEPFHRGAQTRLAGPGTGLGLTLVDTIARALGGALSLAPRAGGGLVATLTLPAAAGRTAPTR